MSIYHIMNSLDKRSQTLTGILPAQMGLCVIDSILFHRIPLFGFSS